VVAEHYQAGKDIYYHSEKIKEISKSLGWKTDSKGRIDALIDSAANQKTLASNKSVSELFYDNGIMVNPKVNKDLFSGIQRVKRYFNKAEGVPKIYIFKSCVNLIRELKGYFWGNGDAPVKKDDHSLDELRYYIMTKPSLEKKPQEKNAIQKDKERLIRRIVNEKKRR
jgi:hypothetical protein